MQYLVLIHKNVTSQPTAEEWQSFFQVAEEAGCFRGGSALSFAQRLGPKVDVATADVLGGFMRFDADSAAALDAVLQQHPVIVHGGSIEIFEMPQDTV